MDQPSVPKAASLYSQLAKRKVEAHRSGESTAFYGKTQPTRFRHPDKPIMPRGGRNGNGKP